MRRAGQRLLHSHEIDRFSRTSSRLEDQAFDLFVSEIRNATESSEPRPFASARLGLRTYRTLEEFKRDYPNEVRASSRRLDDGSSTLYRNRDVDGEP